MVREPCCEKMGLKKGPWTTEEDQILVSHINLHGHGNWRALPKLAGLLRCGKSCRLRWIIYLRPGIKRGNFSIEEEYAIINLHQMLGNRCVLIQSLFPNYLNPTLLRSIKYWDGTNRIPGLTRFFGPRLSSIRWSAIAARLPGRTDNELKNVWHTHLKKRLKQPTKEDIKMDMSRLDHTTKDEQLIVNVKSETSDFMLSPPPQCSSGTAFATMMSILIVDSNPETAFSDRFCTIDGNFWLGVFPTVDSGIGKDFDGFDSDSKAHENIDFRFNVFTKSEELQEMML